MGWIGWIHCNKIRCEFVAWTFALIAPVQHIFCNEFHAVTKQSKMHPNTTKRTNTWVKIPMRGIRCVNCEKFRCDFMAQTCALIAPFQTVLHRVLTINETLPNAPKHYETHQTMSLGINWWIGCVLFEKFWRGFMARTCALILSFQPTLHRLSCNNETIQNAPKHYEMHQIMNLWPNGVDRVCSLRKISDATS